LVANAWISSCSGWSVAEPPFSSWYHFHSNHGQLPDWFFHFLFNIWFRLSYHQRQCFPQTMPFVASLGITWFPWALRSSISSSGNAIEINVLQDAVQLPLHWVLHVILVIFYKHAYLRSRKAIFLKHYRHRGQISFHLAYLMPIWRNSVPRFILFLASFDHDNPWSSQWFSFHA